MSAAPTVPVAGEAVSPRRWTEVALPGDAPPVFVADPPTDLTGPSTGGFIPKAKSPHGATADAKSPHGITRAGVVVVNERPPSSGHPVDGRRPVVAVLDTAISKHPWLGDGTGPDPFWRVPGPEEMPEPWHAPVLAPADLSNPEQALAASRVQGHGTFIAGIIRQIAPEARILSLPVMSVTGHADTPVVLEALGWLLRRVQHARTTHRPELFVDVVNLSFGWYRGKGETVFPAEEHRAVLDGLGAEGVRVVASAGNRSTTTPVYPAAFALEQIAAGAPATPLVSVGALDPDGEVAAYSNTGDWVLLEAPGTGLVSTVPKVSDVDWSQPLVDDLGCRYPNPNHQARGFARWGGTSFAAAWVSAQIAAHLLDDGAHLAGLSLDAIHARAATALAATETEIGVWKEHRHAPA